ncbi:response regulator transcription factor [Phenylobacterium sp.]|uniref:response regulator n=1 Tax=Phenylobacterium sp. TaxID=1871053 RepID=UPI0025F6AC6A|nr:response regulator transcription factor [Phenylobacterium sp.]
MKILIVDDHALVRQGVSALLERHAGAQVLQAQGSAEGLALALEHDDLDAVFLDLSMPGMDGMSALREFGQTRPALPVIVLTAADDPNLVRRAFAAGALGYVPKSATADTLLSALRLVLAGEVFVPALVLREPAPAAAVAAPWAAPASITLTGRQTEVLRHLGEGLSNKVIAYRMGVSEKTVKAHMTGVLRALAVGGRAEAIQSARAAGLI